MKKGKMFKKSISCLLAALMIIASMPFSAISASAADNTLTIASNTIRCAGNTDRLKDSGKTLQITNDGQAENFSYAIWQYKISDLKNNLVSSNLQIDTASVDYVINNVDSQSTKPVLNFYYSTTYDELIDGSNAESRKNKTDFITNISQRSVSEDVGGTYRADCLVSWYGLNLVDSKSTSQLAGGKITVDYSKAIDDAINKGLNYFTVVALQPKRPNTDKNATWSDINMANNQYNITYTTKFGTCNNSSVSISNPLKGVVYNSGDSRFSNNVANIVNDQQNSNCDIGFLSFDTSSLSIDNIASAIYNFTNTIKSSGRESLGLTVGYATKNIDVFNAEKVAISTLTYDGTNLLYPSGNQNTANTNFISNATKAFGIEKLASYATSLGDTNKSRSVDIAPALKWAKNNGNKVVITFMLSNAGGSGEDDTDTSNGTTNGAWSDTSVDLSNSILNVIYKTSTFSSPANTNPLVKKLIDNGAYTGNAIKAADGSYTKNNLAGGDELSNVLWSYGVSSNAPYKSAGDSDWYDSGVQYGEITFLYDGANTMACPVNFFVKRTGWGANSGYNQKPHSVYAMSTNYVQLNHYWHGTNTSATYQTSTDYCVNTVNSHTVANTKSKDLTYRNETNYYSNSLYLKPEYLGFGTSNLFTIENTEWHFYVADDNKSETSGFDKTLNTSGSTNGNMTIRVLNYKPIKDAMSEMKSFYYKNVYGQENYYTSASLSEYYDAISKVCFDPNSYFDTSSTSGNNYTACLNALNDAVSAVDTAKGKNLVKRKVNVTYRFINGTEKVQQENAGELASDLTEHTSNSGKYVDITADSHKTVNYVWNIPNVKLLNDTVIEETQVLGDSEYHDFSDNKEECACGYKVDFSAYNNACGEYVSILYTQPSPYETTSYSAYKTKVDKLQGLRNSVHSQADIDKITFDILFAKTELKKKTGTVTLTVYDQNNQEITGAGKSYTSDYGEEITITPNTTYNVYKYVIEKDGATSEIYGQQSISYVVTGGATVKAYCNKVQTEDEKYTKVTFVVGGKISDIKYVKPNETLDTSTANKLQFPFFTTGKWDKESVQGSADVSSVTVRAELKPVDSDKCGVYIPGNDGNYTAYQKDYDAKVDVTEYGLDGSSDYALSKSPSKDDIIAYMHGTVFYVPARSKVYVIPVDKGESSKQPKVNTVGTFTSVDDNYKYVGFNCKFSLAEGCTPVEWGITFIPMNADFRPVDANGNPTSSTDFRIDTHSKENEYAATLSLSKNSTKYSAIRAKAYLKYKDADNNIQVIYGDEYDQAFATENKFGITK